MAGSKFDYAEAITLNMFLGGTSYSPPATLYLALSTGAYADASTGASMTEVSGGGYIRLAVTNNSTNWPAATGTSPTTKTNGTAMTFATASGSWGTVASFAVADSSSGAGNLIYGGDLSASKTIGSGDTATFASSAITVTED